MLNSVFWVVLGVLVLVALFWPALGDRGKLWVVCALAAGAGMLAMWQIERSLTPEQRTELEVRRADEALIQQEVQRQK